MKLRPLTAAVRRCREIQLIVEGVIQGEVRDMFSGRQNFRRVITDNVRPGNCPSQELHCIDTYIIAPNMLHTGSHN